MTEFEMHDAVIVGAGVSGSFIAKELTAAGMRCVMLEAGPRFERHTYPRTEVDANSQMYWGGGIELNHDASIGLLRPKVVGGGSVVNQALLDRFDTDAFDSWRAASDVSFFEPEEMAPWYDKAESSLCLQEIPEEYRNRNARIFQEGFANNGYQSAPLRRAQRDCRYQDGNDCIRCLWGCPIESKQSMPVAVLPHALANGLTLVSGIEATRVEVSSAAICVTGRTADGSEQRFLGRRLILAAGAIGNSALMLRSGFSARLPALGRNFYTHPQYMNLGMYADPVNSHKGPLQSMKSADPNFRRSGFKLENVFGPPGAVAMLVPGFGRRHQSYMQRISHMACIEVCVRDTNPGRIRLTRSGRVVVEKTLNAEDRARRDRGLAAIRNIFLSTGAKEIVQGNIAIGLHLMGGLGMGTDPGRSVVGSDFRVHSLPNVWAADSSVFPNAPGINPSLTIMALSLKAAAEIVKAG